MSSSSTSDRSHKLVVAFDKKYGNFLAFSSPNQTIAQFPQEYPLFDDQLPCRLPGADFFQKMQWAINDYPELSCIQNSTHFTGPLFQSLSLSDKIPQERDGDKWRLPSRVCNEWIKIETQLCTINSCLAIASARSYAQRFPKRFPIPAEYGYRLSFSRPEDLLTSVTHSRNAFLTLMAKTSLLIASMTPSAGDVDGQPPAWITKVLDNPATRDIPLPFLQAIATSQCNDFSTNPRVGVVVDPLRCTHLDFVEDIANRGVPVWFFWGSEIDYRQDVEAPYKDNPFIIAHMPSTSDLDLAFLRSKVRCGLLLPNHAAALLSRGMPSTSSKRPLAEEAAPPAKVPRTSLGSSSHPSALVPAIPVARMALPTSGTNFIPPPHQGSTQKRGETRKEFFARREESNKRLEEVETTEMKNNRRDRERTAQRGQMPGRTNRRTKVFIWEGTKLPWLTLRKPVLPHEAEVYWDDEEDYARSYDSFTDSWDIWTNCEDEPDRPNIREIAAYSGKARSSFNDQVDQASTTTTLATVVASARLYQNQWLYLVKERGHTQSEDQWKSPASVDENIIRAFWSHIGNQDEGAEEGRWIDAEPEWIENQFQHYETQALSAQALPPTPISFASAGSSVSSAPVVLNLTNISTEQMSLYPSDISVKEVDEADSFESLLKLRYGLCPPTPYNRTAFSRLPIELTSHQARMKLNSVKPNCPPLETSACDFVSSLATGKTIAEFWNGTPLPTLWDLSFTHPSHPHLPSNPHFSIKKKRLDSQNQAVEAAYEMLFSQADTWRIVLTDPITVLQMIRSSWGPSRSDVIVEFLRRGIPFHTISYPSPEPPLPVRRNRPQRYWRPSNYKGTPMDYAQYQYDRDLFLSQPKARAALLKGGILWRLAKDTVDAQWACSGPSEDASAVFDLHKTGGATPYDDCLSEADIDQIIGVYEIYTGQVSQTSISSWWPSDSAWRKSGLNVGYWSSTCENWFMERLQNIKEGKADLRTSEEWKKALNFRVKKLQTILSKTRKASTDFIDKHIIQE